MKENNEVQEAIETIVMATVIYILSILMCGFTVMYLWNNILPVIFGIRTITLAQAIAIDLLISFIVTTQVKDNNHNIKDLFVKVLSTCLSTLLVGWIVIQFI